MYTPSLPEFLKLSRRCNVIPVYKEISADLDTPVSAFLKLDKNAYGFLLESVEGQENIARYSFLGSRPSLVIQSKGRRIRILEHGRRRSFDASGDPLDEIKKIMKHFKAAQLKGLPRFYGGLVGYIGYDMVRFFETIPDKNPDTLAIPDSCMMLTDTMLVFDHVNHSIKIISNVIFPSSQKTLSVAQKKLRYAKAIAAIEKIHRAFKPRALMQGQGRSLAVLKKIKIESNFKKSKFCGIVDKAKEYIRKGDIIQVVLSQRFKARVAKKPFDIYRSLRSLNPSPYMFFLQLDETTLIGSSPEMLVRCEDGSVATRPIAGTRKRGLTPSQDARMEHELRRDAKERAEHIMLVDLGRNDLGRVCAVGAVRVSEFMEVERYSHVMHLVSEVTGTLKRGYDAYDTLRACFPAGTVSGSPKIRAMEIIDELENTRRGPYAGCVGYFSFSHNMDTCITIRTIILKGEYAYVQAGAGIVADSIPAKEYQESVHKAKALLEALG